MLRGSSRKRHNWGLRWVCYIYWRLDLHEIPGMSKHDLKVRCYMEGYNVLVMGGWVVNPYHLVFI
jgi:hypothetical protein